MSSCKLEVSVSFPLLNVALAHLSRLWIDSFSWSYSPPGSSCLSGVGLCIRSSLSYSLSALMVGAGVHSRKYMFVLL